jgi:hypothetical protein
MMKAGNFPRKYFPRMLPEISRDIIAVSFRMVDSKNVAGLKIMKETAFGIFLRRMVGWP